MPQDLPEKKRQHAKIAVATGCAHPLAGGYIDFHGHVANHYVIVGWMHSQFTSRVSGKTAHVTTSIDKIYGSCTTVFFDREDTKSFGLGVVFIVHSDIAMQANLNGLLLPLDSGDQLFMEVEAHAVFLDSTQILQRLQPVLAGSCNLREALLTEPRNTQVVDSSNSKLNISNRSEAQGVKKRQVFLQKLIKSHSVLLNKTWICAFTGISNATYKDHNALIPLLLDLGDLPEFTTSPLFDPAWYRRHARAKADNFFDCLEHYLSVGEAFGLSPNAFLPIPLYVARNKDLSPILARHEGETYLEHFIRYGSAEARTQTIHFHEAYYSAALEADGQLLAHLELDPFAHYVAAGWREGRSPNPLFDELWYISRYPDVANALSRGDYPNAFSHYLFRGEVEHRLPNPFFDPELYLNLNEDVASALKSEVAISAFSHFWQNGFREGRRFDLTGLGTLLAEHFSDHFPVLRSICNLERPETKAIAAISSDHLVTAFRCGDVKPLLEQARLILELGKALTTEYRYALQDWFSVDGRPALRVLEFEHPTIYPGECYYLHLSGFAFLPFGKLVNMFCEISGTFVPCEFFRTTRVDFARTNPASVLFGGTLEAGFFARVKFDTTGLSPGHVDLRLSFVFELLTGEKEFIGSPLALSIATPPERSGTKANAQVCMATYNPTAKPFSHQLATILNQQGGKPAVLISDDNSEYARRLDIHNAIAGLQAVTFSPSRQNLGFIGNFERSLRLRSVHAKLILFSDQDDSWYKTKIRMLTDRLKTTGASCVFSDMRVVKSDGEVIADSFWAGKRKLHYGDPIALAVANTVTGAASLFTAELASKLAPFPRFLQIYHDQWLAVAASALGPIAYVDEPLYDYIQHGSNVLGFSGSRGGETDKWRAIARRMATLRHRSSELWSDKDCDFFILAADQLRGALLQRFVLLREALERIETWFDSKQQKAAIAFCAVVSTLDYSNVMGLVRYWRLMRGAVGGDAALIGIDYLLKAALYVHMLPADHCNKISHRIYRRLTETSVSAYTNRDIWTNENVGDLDRKIRPIALAETPVEYVRVNIFLPELRFATFFGGYYSKVAFAKQLIAANVRVRVILVDQPVVDYEEVLLISNSYPDLSQALDAVEIIAVGNRERALDVSRNDIMVATTWWTAYIVEHVRASLSLKRFFYFIQEYEPFTFPMGTWYRAAEASYEFPHTAIFSTEMLSEYFHSIGAGVFKAGVASISGGPLVFRNPIVGLGSIQRKPQGNRRHRLLFYARPQAHAARNMYDFGLAALRLVTKRLGEQASAWEFIGIGAGSTIKVPLSQMADLQMMDKLNFDGYRDILSTSSVGVVLMYTPHPSLVPLEMAAAGLETVTNSCFSKTADSFRNISTKIIVAEPTVSAIADAIIEAMFRISQGSGERIDAKLEWPDSPEGSFPKEWIEAFLSNALDV